MQAVAPNVVQDVTGRRSIERGDVEGGIGCNGCHNGVIGVLVQQFALGVAQQVPGELDLVTGCRGESDGVNVGEDVTALPVTSGWVITTIIQKAGTCRPAAAQCVAATASATLGGGVGSNIHIGASVAILVDGVFDDIALPGAIFEPRPVGDGIAVKQVTILQRILAKYHSRLCAGDEDCCSKQQTTHHQGESACQFDVIIPVLRVHAVSPVNSVLQRVGYDH
jgi:hypothetical protein